MSNMQSSDSYFVEIPGAIQQAELRKRAEDDRRNTGPWSYEMRRGRQTVQLNNVENRILCFLAAKPYRAYTRRRIAAAVSTGSQPVTTETLGLHIASLRDKLGFFADYIQSVPYIGYRFKA